ncbi:MAG TPA: TonB-dependent receptor plug domain-containing protein, partial [Opitutus sp.]|nr:TonB-dependent receptor plug domain-containing protein [Opitutus sp.]
MIRLAPFVVEEKSDRRSRLAAAETFREQEAIGNLDLPRTLDDALPYTIFEREQIFRSGAATLEDFLRRELLDSAGGSSAAQKSGSGGLSSLVADSTTLKLRGFAADETVILVNGRRLPETVTSGANAVPQSSNVGFIPISLVERVEVLPISASAIYSGNPVGGVINIVLRPNANVSELNVHHSNALGGFDAPQSTVSLLHGQSLLGGALRFRLNAAFTEVMPPTESELGYIQRHVGSPAANAPRLHRATPNIRSASGGPLFGTGSSAVSSVAPGADGSGGLQRFAERAGVRSLALFDAPVGLANTPGSVDFPYGQRQRTESAFASATYDVFSRLQVGIDAMYSLTTVNRGLDVFAADLRLAADSPFNPFGQAVDVSLQEIAPLLGPSYSHAEREFSSLVFGAMLRLPGDWRVSFDT